MRVHELATSSGPWLGIDSATDQAGLALVQDDQVLAERSWRSRRRHTEELAPALSEMLDGAGLAVSSLAGIGVAIGPGSYTGLRIGLSLAKGMALPSGIPVIGVPTLDALAAELSLPERERERDLWAVLDAGRGRIVAARYPPGGWIEGAARPEGWPAADSLVTSRPAALLEQVRSGDWVAGELDVSLREALEAAGLNALAEPDCLRRTRWVASLALRLQQQGAEAPGMDLSPVYLGGG